MIYSILLHTTFALSLYFFIKYFIKAYEKYDGNWLNLIKSSDCAYSITSLMIAIITSIKIFGL